MKAGRKSLPAPIATEGGATYPKQTPADMAQQEREANIARNALDQYSNTMRVLGRIDAYNQVGNSVRCAEILHWLHIKDSKEYKDLPYNDEHGNTVHVRSFEEFCRCIAHKSVDVVDELLKNARAFGEEFLEGQSKLGISDRAVRALRLAAPSEDKDAVVERIRQAKGDATEIREAIADLITPLEKENRELKEVQEANEEQIAAKDKKINQLDKKLSRRSNALPWDEELKEFSTGLRAAADAMIESTNACTVTIGEMAEKCHAAPADQRIALAHAIVDDVNRFLEAAGNLQLLVGHEFVPLTSVGRATLK